MDKTVRAHYGHIRVSIPLLWGTVPFRPAMVVNTTCLRLPVPLSRFMVSLFGLCGIGRSISTCSHAPGLPRWRTSGRQRGIVNAQVRDAVLKVIPAGREQGGYFGDELI
jgi:hypothetical protein